MWVKSPKLFSENTHGVVDSVESGDHGEYGKSGEPGKYGD